MRTAVRLAGILLLAAAFLPDLSRHAAERTLYRASALLSSAFTGNVPGADPRRLAVAAADLAARASHALPFDPRPPLVEGIARLALGDAASAEACSRESIARAEKPEALVNLGRALLVSQRPDAARAVFLRAAWLHPLSVSSLPAAFRQEALAGAEERRGRLRRGESAEIPALPGPGTSPRDLD